MQYPLKELLQGIWSRIYLLPRFASAPVKEYWLTDRGSVKAHAGESLARPFAKAACLRVA